MYALRSSNCFHITEQESICGAPCRADAAAIEFPDGNNVLVTQLAEGQRVIVLQFARGSSGYGARAR
jgi:hypothetical protein